MAEGLPATVEVVFRAEEVAIPPGSLHFRARVFLEAAGLAQRAGLRLTSIAPQLIMALWESEETLACVATELLVEEAEEVTLVAEVRLALPVEEARVTPPIL